MNEAELQAYDDERLQPGRRQAIEAWLATHPEDANRVSAYRALNEQSRAAYAALLAEPVPTPLLSLLRSPRRRALRAVAIAAGLAAIVMGVWLFADPSRGRTGAGAEIVRRAAIAHAVYADDVAHPVESDADGRVQLLAWLSERLNMSVRTPDLNQAGLSFIGGRLLPGEKAAVALLMYEGASGQRVTLYWAPEYRQAEDTGLQFAVHAPGTRVYYWLDDECGYAIASADLSREDLLRVATLAHEQLED